MKIGSISDIHIDINRSRGYPDVSADLLHYIEGLGLDVLIIPGDISGTSRTIENFFIEADTLSVPVKIFVPGNHDIWVNGKTSDGSMIKYTSILPGICSNHGWHYLPGNPLTLGRTAFLGAMGWYDYSLAGDKGSRLFSNDVYEKKISPGGAMWMDGEYARFGMSDTRASALMVENLNNDLKKIKILTDAGGADETSSPVNVIVVTHFIPYRDFVYSTGDPDYDFFNAFMGSAGLGECINTLPQHLRRIALFGHTHRPMKRAMESGVEAVCAPLGYPSDHGMLSFHEALNRRVAVFTVEN